MWNWRKIITIKMYTESFTIENYYPFGAFKKLYSSNLASGDAEVLRTFLTPKNIIRFDLCLRRLSKTMDSVWIIFFNPPSSGILFGMKCFPTKFLSKSTLSVAFEISAGHDFNIQSLEMFSSLSWERFLSSGRDVFSTGKNKMGLKLFRGINFVNLFWIPIQAS